MKKSNRVVLVTLMLLAFVLMFAACGTVNVQQVETSRITTGLLNFSVSGEAIAETLASNENFGSEVEVLGNYNDNDSVNVIITMGKGSLIENYLKNAGSYGSAAEYVVSDAGVMAAEAMNAQYESIVATMKGNEIEFEVNSTLFALVNGFSVTMKYSEYKKLAEVEGIDSYSIATQYSVPQVVDQSVYSFAEKNGLLSNSTGYNGEGMVVAILDSAFDIEHEAFTQAPVNPALDLADLEALWGSYAFTAGQNWIASGIYKNEKVPFAYDYGDKDNDVICRDMNGYRYYSMEHGTHVAGIVLGNSEKIQGAAYNAQLVGMKVACDYQGTIYLDSILAALGDAILLGVDAVNISIGSTSGGETYANPYLDYMNKAYELAEKCGVSVTAAAGNDYNAGEGINGSLVQNPDNGLIGAPGSLNAVNTAGSVNANATQYITIDGKDYTFTNSAKMDLTPNDFYDVLGDKDKATFEYVIVPNYGTQADFATVDVKGKIAITMRGNNTLADKAVQAANAGAVGCIIINTDEQNIIAVIGEAPVPTMCVRASIGNIIRNAASKTITIDRNNSFFEMSIFSSWGPTTSLDIGIDMTAPGGNVYSSLPKAYTDMQGFSEAYGFMSGTSMAAPNVTAAVLAVKQYIKAEYPGITSVQAQTLAYQLLMSTASIAEDTQFEPVSPRKQGAGILNIDNAINTRAYLEVVGSNKTKLNLGSDIDKEGIYTLKFNVVNMSNEEISYEVGAMVFTETVHMAQIPSMLNRVGTRALASMGDVAKIANQAYMLEGADIAIRAKNGEVDGDVITVGAGQTASLTIVITLTEEHKNYMEKNFPNGIYVEGFATLTALDEADVDLSIPYISFFGDWNALPMFEPYASEVLTNGVATFQARTIRLMQFYDGKSGMSLGLDMGGFYEMHHIAPGYATPAFDMDKGAIGALAEVTPYILEIALNRHAEFVELRVEDSISGSIYNGGEVYNVTKTYYKYGQGQLGNDICLQLAMPGFTPSNYDLANNSVVNYVLRAYFDLSTGEYQDLVMPVYVDTEAPTLQSAEVKVENGRYILYMDVYDNHYMMDYTFYVDGYNGLKPMINGYIPVTTNVKNGTNKLSFDITNYIDKIGEGNLTVEFFDYARNTVKYELEFNNNNVGESEEIFTPYGAEPLDVVSVNYEVKTSIAELTAVREEKFELNTRGIEPTVVPTADGDQYFWIDGNGTLTGYGGPGGRVVLPDNVKAIGRYAFYYNEQVTELVINEGCTTFQGYSFYMTGIKQIYAPSTLTTIEDYAMTGAYNLEVFDISRSPLTYIGRQAMANCNFIKELVIAETANITVEQWGMYGLINLEKLVINGRLSLRNALLLVPSLRILEVNGTLNIDNTIYESSFDFLACENLETIIFRGNQENIGWSKNGLVSWGLCDMPKVKEIIFEGDVQEINGFTLTNMPNLEKVQFNGNVGVIGPYAFDDCPKLTHFTVGENNPYLIYDEETGVVYNKDKTEMFIAPHWGYEGTFTVPETVKTLKEAQFGVGQASSNRPLAYSAFSSPASGSSIRYLVASNYAKGESLVSGIVLHDDIKTIPDYCFKDCVNLNEEGFRLENSKVTKVGKYAFQNTGYKTFYCETGSDSAIIFDNYFLAGCTKLEKIEYSNDPQGAMIYAFCMPGCTSLVNVNIPYYYQTARMKMFDGCNNLETVTFNGYVSGIEAQAFLNTPSLKTVTASNWNNWKIQAIGQLAFNNSGIESIEIPNTCTQIYLQAFEGAKRLKSIGTGDGGFLHTIGDRAFYGCESLQYFFLPDTVKTIGADAFVGCSSLIDIWISAGNNSFTVKEGVLYTRDMTELVAFAGSRAYAEYTLPETITTVTTGMFTGTRTLKTLNLPAVTNIEAQAFEYSSVVEVNAPALVRIDSGAFVNAESLTTIDLSNVEYIGTLAFWNTAVEEVTLGANLEYLGYAVFKEGNVKTVRLESGFNGEFDLAGSFYQSGWSNVELEENSGYVMYQDGLYNEDMTILHKYFGSEQLITLPEGLIKISHEAFINNTNLLGVSFPSTLEVIGDKAFYGCTTLYIYEFKSEKAPSLQSYYTGARYPYNQFVKAVDDLKEGEHLNAALTCPKNDSYRTPAWRLYFGKLVG